MKTKLATVGLFIAAMLLVSEWFQSQAQAQSSQGGASDVAALRQRVDQLEEQLVEMQVVIGTLESLAKGGVTSARSAMPQDGFGGQASGDLAFRLGAVEMQIQALSQQIQQLGSRSGTSGQFAPTNYDRSGAGTAVEGYRAQSNQPDGGGETSFGSLSITQGGADPIGKMIQGDQQVAAFGAGNSEQAYEQAYGFLLQQNYGAAEAAFSDFLARFPNDDLAGNAQYWLGESHYVRGQYRRAAGAFLKGYKTYKSSPKAQDSLLKLAMSLSRLGQKDVACTTFGEFGQRFPSAPSHMRQRAKAERKRAGC